MRGKTSAAFWASSIIPAMTLFAPSAFSDILDPIRLPGQLVSPVSERAVRVKTARVLITDYALLKRDFPSLQGKSSEEIDRWILDTAGYVSEPQAGQTVVNSAIETEKDAAGQALTRDAIRPNTYNRALVFRAGNEGLIDMKGAGTLRPAQRGHGNGLATTGEAIREFIYEHKVQQILQHAGLRNRTVGCYAVIDWGFEVVNADGSRDPAGAVLRQAHERFEIDASRGNTFLDRADSEKIEKALRRYGMTSSGESWLGEKGDVINIQGNAKGELVDFGSYLVRPDFDKPTYTYMDGQRIRHGLKVEPVLLPGTPQFVHPDPDLRLPFNVWGYSVTGKADPKFDNLWVWSHELSKNLRDGRAQRQDVLKHFNNMMNANHFGPANARPVEATPVKPAAEVCSKLFHFPGL